VKLILRKCLYFVIRGVVQLFNAISMQQKTVRTKLRESKKSEFAKDNVMGQSKELFDSALTKTKRAQAQQDSSPLSRNLKIKKEEEDSDEEEDSSSKSRKRKSSDNKTNSRNKKPAWTALQDDFMLDAKLKDWDKSSESEAEADADEY
jgi:hypothetical protein